MLSTLPYCCVLGKQRILSIIEGLSNHSFPNLKSLNLAILAFCLIFCITSTEVKAMHLISQDTSHSPVNTGDNDSQASSSQEQKKSVFSRAVHKVKKRLGANKASQNLSKEPTAITFAELQGLYSKELNDSTLDLAGTLKRALELRNVELNKRVLAEQQSGDLSKNKKKNQREEIREDEESDTSFEYVSSFSQGNKYEQEFVENQYTPSAPLFEERTSEENISNTDLTFEEIRAINLIDQALEDSAYDSSRASNSSNSDLESNEKEKKKILPRIVGYHYKSSAPIVDKDHSSADEEDSNYSDSESSVFEYDTDEEIRSYENIPSSHTGQRNSHINYDTDDFYSDSSFDEDSDHEEYEDFPAPPSIEELAALQMISEMDREAEEQEILGLQAMLLSDNLTESEKKLDILEEPIIEKQVLHVQMSPSSQVLETQVLETQVLESQIVEGLGLQELESETLVLETQVSEKKEKEQLTALALKEEIIENPSMQSNPKEKSNNIAASENIAELNIKAQEHINNAHETIKASQTMVRSVVDVAHKSIKDRLGLLQNPYLSALGAGDVDEDEEEGSSIRGGIWVSGSYGVSKQKETNKISAYKGRMSAVTIGTDIKFNDNDLIGIAYSHTNSNFKYDKSANSTKIKGHLVSIYHHSELSKALSLQSVLSVSKNQISNNYNKSLNQTINGKYNNTHIGMESVLSYRFNGLKDIQIIPNIGLRYDYDKYGSYTETDGSSYRVAASGKREQLWSGMIGVKTIFPTQKINYSDIKEINITPALHASLEKAFNPKEKRIGTKATIQNQALEPRVVIIPTQEKLGYNVGGSILAEQKNIKLQFEYNCYLQSKYRSHQGLIKLKIEF